MLTPCAAPRILPLSVPRATGCDGEHEAMEGINQHFATVRVWFAGRPWAVGVRKAHVWLRQCAARQSSRGDGGCCMCARSCRERRPAVWLLHAVAGRGAATHGGARPNAV